MRRPSGPAVGRVLAVGALAAVVVAGFVGAEPLDGPDVITSTKRAGVVVDVTPTTIRPSAARPARTVTIPVDTTRPPTTPPPPTTLPPTTAPTTLPPAPPPVAARPVPPPQPPAAPPAGPVPPWAATTAITSAGYVGTRVGCATGTDAAALDTFFRQRMGPVLGHDYQHVYDLGDSRQLWLFQDTFLDHAGTATRLDQAAFAHNTAMVQDGACFQLLHRGSTSAPASFEPGTGERTLSRWFWPLGGEVSSDRLHVFWAEMSKTADPAVPDGLGWVPAQTWLATYRLSDLARLDFRPAPESGVDPIYGYAVASDDTHTYLFGNTFDQNLARQGGYHACPCSAATMFLARVPRGHLDAMPEYWTGSAWSATAGDARSILQRFHAENPMQPRRLAGQWVAVTKVDGYWGEELVVDVARDPWGPWTTVSRQSLPPRAGDSLMNTYHAHLMPWLAGDGLVVSVSQNARDMARHAYPEPSRYRLQFLAADVVQPPAPTTTTSSTTTTTSTTSPKATTTTTLPPPTPSTTTSSTTTSSTTTSSTTTSTTSTSTTSTTSTTLAPPTTG